MRTEGREAASEREHSTTHAPSAFVLTLGVCPPDPSIVGGKAANLGSMVRAGIRVPNGFCLSTRAYEAFISLNGLEGAIDRAVEGIDARDPASFHLVSQRVRQLLLSAPFPDDVRQDLLHAYRELGDAGVAVRSSAVREDRAEATFAGQHETLLNVIGEAALERAVRACWASLYSPQALSYRATRGGDHAAPSLAIVVQRMIDPAAAGVAFTANPLTGDRGEMHISATSGLGEALASGRVTPDTFVLREPSLEIAYVEVGEKAIAIRLGSNGGIVEQPVPKSQRSTLAIAPDVALEIGRQARALAEHFGSPQDVEWAFDGQRLFVLQSRPMVMPEAESVRWESPVPGARWYRNWRLGEWLGDPVTPLFAASLLPVLAEGRENRVPQRLGWDLPKVFSMLRPWFCIVNGYFYTRDDRDQATREYAGGAMAESVDRVRDQVEALRQWRRRDRPKYLRRLQRLQRFDAESASGPEILRFLDELYGDAAEWWYLVSMIGFGSEERRLRSVYEDYFGDQDKPPPVVFFSGFDNHALRSQRELHAIAETIVQRPGLNVIFTQYEPSRILADLAAEPGGAEIEQRLNRFRAAHGHQVFSLDFGQPTLSEQPEAIIAIVQSYLRQDAPAPGSKLERQRRRRLAARRRLREIEPRQPELRKIFEAHLAWRSECASLRENVIYDFQRFWPLIRRALLELGGRLASQGAILEPDDVFFLTQSELTSAAGRLDAANSARHDFRTVVAERRAECLRQARLSPPDRIGGMDSQSADRSVRAAEHTGRIVEDEAGRRLLGQPASPGRSRGPARVIRSIGEFGKLRKGDILVCVTATPAWTVLFPLAAGLVTEVGGGATHSSLIAREYGLPAVVATGIATQVIRDGQIITVDGSRGVVYLAETSAATR